jgi:hypothetical protein
LGGKVFLIIIGLLGPTPLNLNPTSDPMVRWVSDKCF